MNRRTFVRHSAALLGSAASARHSVAAAQRHARHIVGRIIDVPDVPVPAKMRAPFGWKTAAVTSNNSPLVCVWPNLTKAVTPTHLRFAVGLDERDEKTVEVFLPKSGRVVGSTELRFVSQFQIHQLRLTTADVAGIRREGAGLRLTKGSDLEILAGGANVPAALLPHLLVPGTADARSEYFLRLNSLACVQPFGWMEGCVLDGLLDLAARPRHAHLKDAANKHLALFFKGDHLVYENNMSAPSDDKLYGIEGGLPFAALARVAPRHTLLELALEFWQSRQRPTGAIQDGGHMSSEGAYTVGYALAEIARARQSEELMRLALTQVRVRQATLFDGWEFWRTRNDDGRRTNRNWARGIAWQLLGLARTLTVAKGRNDIADLVTSLRQLSAWAMALQREDGLWSVFADEPTLTPDTGGSAGIAAALAIGAKHGWLDARARVAAAKTRAGLQKHLTPDGLLGGVSQPNKGGEALQRSDYRTIYQMGMGLMAQLEPAYWTAEVKR